MRGMSTKPCRNVVSEMKCSLCVPSLDLIYSDDSVRSAERPPRRGLVNASGSMIDVNL